MGIEPIHEAEATSNTPVAYYRMDGRSVARPQRGLNIIRYSNGTIRKVIVK